MQSAKTSFEIDFCRLKIHFIELDFSKFKYRSTGSQTNLYFCCVKAVLKISAILLKYPTYESCFVRFSWIKQIKNSSVFAVRSRKTEFSDLNCTLTGQNRLKHTKVMFVPKHRHVYSTWDMELWATLNFGTFKESTETYLIWLLTVAIW